jgi:GNAT superfamily N-acetyltransferase
MDTEGSETIFRSANPQDIEDLRRFEQGIIAAERAFDPTLKSGKIRYYDIERMLAADDVKFVVALRRNQLIGCGFARIDNAKTYLSHMKQGYLGMMYVEPQHRGQSINRGIISRLKQWCFRNGVTELRLEVYRNNVAAIGAYEKAGFSSHIIEMRLGLGNEAP